MVELDDPPEVRGDDGRVARRHVHGEVVHDMRLMTAPPLQ